MKKRIQHRCFIANIANIFKSSYFEEHLQMAASVLINIDLVISYWAFADLFLIKNITWNGFS